ncbi:unnamed protein product [Owenia fusiformis]|uniref:Uncharacterized protein n=1 Tax=Owenia fusiformis TaxID=6347 RepID=A0A8J1UMX2_OWEFU|nr:unnamed protein product [Owenia fusiformis]
MADADIYDVVDDAEREGVEEITDYNEASHYAAEDVELVPETIIQAPTPNASVEDLNVTDVSSETNRQETSVTEDADIAAVYANDSTNDDAQLESNVSIKDGASNVSVVSSRRETSVTEDGDIAALYAVPVKKSDRTKNDRTWGGATSDSNVSFKDGGASNVKVVSSRRETSVTNIQHSSSLSTRTAPIVMSGTVALPNDQQIMPGPMIDRDVDNVHIRHLSDNKGHHSQVSIDGPKIPPVKYIHKTTMLDRSGVISGAVGVGTTEYAVQRSFTATPPRRYVNRDLHNEVGFSNRTEPVDESKYQYRISQDRNPHVAHVDIRGQRDDKAIGMGANLLVSSSGRSSAVTSSNMDALYLETNEIYDSMTSTQIETNGSIVKTGTMANGVSQTVSEGVQTQENVKVIPVPVWYRTKSGRWSPLLWCTLCLMIFLFVLVLVIIAVVIIYNRGERLKVMPTPVPDVGCSTDFPYMDLVFAVDSSGSVGEANFNLTKFFMADVARHLSINPDANRVGAVVFHDTAEIKFNLGDFTDGSKVEEALLSLEYSEGSTHTADALEIIRDQMFNGTNGDRPGTRDVIVIITDGASKEKDPVPIAKSLKDSGVTIYALGIKDDELQEEQIEAMASIPKKDFYFMIDSYDQLDAIVEKITSSSCFQNNLAST